ncbi:unnamed protein product [Rhizophagus irregularis]|uniref:Wax synthase domain-containing protein n=1 Tax=Rhizophagus irregularis TaxID=588596 RepID=A0A2N1N6U6_9GLOM|nr:hypothetical protein RhiirC2_780861 [Rhizophagus irregularis]CAB4398146.1 unnamed protein product [Rhizophagus irregularis]CAB5354518.1 unnamed protein product [Rhizophagus irregularis]
MADNFPPELSFDNYKLLSDLLLISFILLSFHSPRSLLHLIILIIIIICFIIQPIIYKGKYSAIVHSRVSSFAITFGFKMCIWLKNFVNITHNTTVSDFQPFLYTLFYWRKNVTSGKKDDFQPTNKLIIKNILERIVFMFIKWIIYEGCFILVDMYSNINEIPPSPYFFRIFDMFISGKSPITIKLLLLCSLYMVLVYFIMSLTYDQFLLITGIILLFLNIIFPFLSDTNITFFKRKIITIRRWCISFLFDTQYIFNSPWLSTSPREFWSYRWNTFYNEIWKELGYIPLHNYLITSHSFSSNNKKKLIKMMGVLGAFFISGILHEYLLWTETNKLTLEQFNFFLFHGIIFIIWEFISIKNDFKGRIILFLILFFSLPSMIEPYLRYDQWIIPSYFININRISS